VGAALAAKYAAKAAPTTMQMYKLFSFLGFGFFSKPFKSV